MSLRVKVILLILTLNIPSIFALNYLSQKTLISQVNLYKEKHLEKDLRIVKRLVEDRISVIDNSVRDYAYWDDSYEFLSDKNTEYIESNLGKQTFTNLEIDYIAYFDIQGKIFYQSGYHHNSGEKIEISQQLTNSLEELSYTLYSEHLNGSGLITSGDEIFLVAARPILKSNKDGPAVGTLMMLRSFDNDTVQEIKELTQMSFEVIPYKDINKVLDKTAFATLLDRNYYLEGNSEESKAYIMVNGLDDKPALALAMSDEISLSAVLSKYILYFNYACIVILIIMLISAITFMEKLVIRPIRYLVREVDRIRTRKVSSQRLYLRASGELQQLVSNINSMLDTLDLFDKKLVTVNQEMESKALELEENTRELERLNKHMVGRELRMAELKEEIEELEFKLNQKSDDIQ